MKKSLKKSCKKNKIKRRNKLLGVVYKRSFNKFGTKNICENLIEYLQTEIKEYTRVVPFVKTENLIIRFMHMIDVMFKCFEDNTTDVKIIKNSDFFVSLVDKIISVDLDKKVTDSLKKNYKWNEWVSKIMSSLNNIKDNKNKTVLMKVASGGTLKDVLFLLKYGADINLKDINGFTALDYAQENNDPNVEKILKHYIHRRPLEPFLQEIYKRSHNKLPIDLIRYLGEF
jgi:hypothetical protein